VGYRPPSSRLETDEKSHPITRCLKGAPGVPFMETGPLR
jgi:hypothetical protein